jgi:cytosine/adenosine deaminase-related metal-dependent hydrolase
MNARDHEPKMQVLRVDCDAVVDPVEGVVGCCLLAERVDKLSLSWRVLAVGSAEEVGRHPAARYAEVRDGRGSVLIPGLVNAHTHLDLTHIGPRPHEPGDGFVVWVDMIRRERRRDDAGIAESVRRGAELCLAGGTVAVGDIAGSPQGNYTLAPWRAVRSTPLGGVTFIEGFGIGKNWQHLRAGLEEFVQRHQEEFRAAPGEPLRLGLQPHAPNTVELPHYLWYITLAERLGAPLATHLAETMEEREFVARGTGSQRELLERLGVWDDSILEHAGKGLHPVVHMEPVLSRGRFLAAHCNDAPDDAIDVLARTGTSVAYCPRASEYFGAAEHFGPHRYRDMLAAGVNVCLGTDSLVNLPGKAADATKGGMSVLDEMRLLHRRDGTSATDLLRMATVNGARALGMEESRFRIEPGRIAAGVLQIRVNGAAGADPLAAALTSDLPHALLR